MADSSREGKVSKQDLDDSLCEEDFSQTQMPQEPLKLHNISNNNNNDGKYGSNSFSEDKDLQICASNDPCSLICASNDPCSFPPSVHLHDNASIQQSPSILINPQPSPQVSNIQKRKPLFGKKNKSHSSPKSRVTKSTPAATDNNDGNSPANGREIPSDKSSKESLSGGEKSKEKSTAKDASKKKTLTQSTKKPASDEEKLKEKPAKKMTLTKSIEEKKTVDVDKPKKKVSLTAEEKAVKCEQKKQENKVKNRDKEQKKFERERKREENVRLKKEKELKRQLSKDHCDQKVELEHKKREKKFSKGQIDIDKQKKMKPTFAAQREERQTKASAKKKASVKQPNGNDLPEINPTAILDDVMSGMHDLESQDPEEVATNIFISPESPPSGLSSVLSDDIGSPAHNAYLEVKKIMCNDAISPILRSPKQPLPEDALSAAPAPKRAKLDSTVVADQTITGSEKENCSVPRKRKKMTKFHAGSRQPQIKTCMRANMTGPVWVKCCNNWCQKWRQLKDHFDPLTVPTLWKCTENSDMNCNDCSVPMEQWDGYENDKFQFVESAYVPGSLVWGKLGSYPWWPAMVEEDPDEECYYEMGPTNLLVPVKYHVVFFDTPVSRSWLQANNIVPFADETDANREHKNHVGRKYEKNLNEGIKQAKEATKIDVKERLVVYGFSKRHGARSKKATRKRSKVKCNNIKRKLKGEEKEEMNELAMRVAEKRMEEHVEKEKFDMGEGKVRMEGENDQQGPAHPED